MPAPDTPKGTPTAADLKKLRLKGPTAAGGPKEPDDDADTAVDTVDAVPVS